MTTHNTLRSLPREHSGLFLIGLIVVAAAHTIGLLLPVLLPRLMTLGVDIEVTGNPAQWGLGEGGMRGWGAALPLIHAAMICALVYGVITACMSRVSVSAGFTRRATWRESARYLAGTAVVLWVLVLLAVLVALALNPAPQLLEGSMHPLVQLIPAAVKIPAGAALGYLVGMAFMRFHWIVGVVACVGLVTLLTSLPISVQLTPSSITEMVVVTVGAVLLAVAAAAASRGLIDSLQVDP